MATSNIIEVLIRSQVEGGQNLLAFRRELEALKKSGTDAQRVFAQGVLQGMDAELRGVIPQLLQTTQQSEGTTRALEKQSRQTRLLTNDKLGLRRALSLVLVNIGDLGPAGNIASGALLSIATGAGVAGAAIGLTSTAIALIVRHFQEAKEKKEAFDQALRTGNLAFFQAEIAAADRALLDLGTRLDDVRRKLAESQAAGVRGDGFLESLQSGLTGQEGDIAKRRAELVAEQQNILARRAQTAGLQLEFQTEALRANSIEQQELAHQLRITNALQGDLKDAAQETKDAFINQSAVLRDAEIGQILKRQGEESKRKSEAEKKALDSLRGSLLAQIDAANLQLKALTEGEEAAILYGISILAGSDAVKALGAEGERLVRILRDVRLETLAAKEAEDARKQDVKNRVIGLQAELTALDQITEHNRTRIIETDKLIESYNQQAEAIRRANEISLIDDERTRSALTLIAAYEAEVKQLEALITKYPEAEKAIRNFIEARGEQLNSAINKSTEQLTNLQQSLADVFASSIDRSFDALFDKTRGFGERMTALMEGIGETIIKTILHHAITIPLQSGIQQMFAQVNKLSQSSGGGGIFGSILGLISGIGGLFGGGGFVPGSATGVEAAHFAKGGLVLAGAGVGSNVPHMLVNRYNIPKLAQGAIARGPTLAVIGEGGEDEFVVPRSKMEKMMGSKNNGAQSQPTVIINGDITPRRPDMRPEDVVQIVSDNMNRNGPIGKATVNVIKRNR